MGNDLPAAFIKAFNESVDPLALWARTIWSDSIRPIFKAFTRTLCEAPSPAKTLVSAMPAARVIEVLAGEGAAHNVLVNALNIGRIESDQMVRAHKGSGSNDSLKAFIEAAGKSLPMGRLGYADECASLACLLCSDAGGYISGTAINVDGNLSPAL